jgi:hypothetical protein
MGTGSLKMPRTVYRSLTATGCSLGIPQGVEIFWVGLRDLAERLGKVRFSKGEVLFV